MITADELIEGSAIADILQDMVDAIIDVFLAIMSGFFEFFFLWLDAIMTGGILGDNPGILLIGVAFFVTAYIVSIWRGR